MMHRRVIHSIVGGQAALIAFLCGQPKRKSGLLPNETQQYMVKWNSRAKHEVSMIPISILKLIIRYDPETGETHWRRRASWVSSEGYQTERARKAFNTSFAGRPCLVSVDKDGYLCGQIFGKYYRAHRVAFAIENNRWPHDTVDHVNRVRTDNRAENLREATRSEQQKNRSVQKNSETGIPGVHWSKSHGRWMARKTVNGKRVYLGTFYRIEDAARAIRKYV